MRIKLVLILGMTATVLCAQLPPAAGEVTQKHGIRVFLKGDISPIRLPRRGSAPIAFNMSGRIGADDQGEVPQLQTLKLLLNREGRLSSQGIPRCRLGRIDPSTSAEALRACGSSLVGGGLFTANVKIPEQSPFPSRGKVLAFNGRLRGKPVVFAHIYGTEPVPTSYVLPFVIKSTKGTFGTALEASLPRVTGEWGFVTGISIKLDRKFTYRGKRHSFLTAGCPAPKGFNAIPFPLMRASFGFEGGFSIDTTITRTCKTAG